MTREELINIGFSNVYVPSKKAFDSSKLRYNNLFQNGNIITIILRFEESRQDWKVHYISFEGEYSLNLIKQNLENYNLDSVIQFVKKFPFQTF